MEGGGEEEEAGGATTSTPRVGEGVTSAGVVGVEEEETGAVKSKEVGQMVGAVVEVVTTATIRREAATKEEEEGEVMVVVEIIKVASRALITKQGATRVGVVVAAIREEEAGTSKTTSTRMEAATRKEVAEAGEGAGAEGDGEDREVAGVGEVGRISTKEGSLNSSSSRVAISIIRLGLDRADITQAEENHPGRSSPHSSRRSSFK